MGTATRASHTRTQRTDTELDRILAQRLVRVVYQPIVRLADAQVVAYEALSRGPSDSPLERPDRLFAAAAVDGRTVELDWLCRAEALDGAIAAGLAPPHTLFVNAEPAALPHGLPAAHRPTWERAAGLRVVVEITERALTADPAGLLAAVEGIRARGWGVALDDVGADTRSLALMPLVRPDVIKLDLRLVQQQPDSGIAEIMTAVNAQRERTGCVILAEGIETDEHVATARSLGAELGQGWHFGRPAPLPSPAARRPATDLASLVTTPSAPSAPTPYDAVITSRRPTPGRNELLVAMSIHLEQQARGLGPHGVLLAAFQHVRRFTPATRARYDELGRHLALVGVLGADMPAEPASGVRGTTLHAEDPLRSEWSVAVLGPHFSAALVAVDRGMLTGECAPHERFDYVLTHDRDLVVAVAASLVTRINRVP